MDPKDFSWRLLFFIRRAHNHLEGGTSWQSQKKARRLPGLGSCAGGIIIDSPTTRQNDNGYRNLFPV